MAPTPYDPAVLAKSVRDLAIQAQRILNDPSSGPFQIRALSRRITFIQRQVPSCPSSDLARWLESLSQMVQAAYEAERRSRQTRSTPQGIGVA